MKEKQFTVIDEAGIHARPAQLLVNTANEFESTIQLLYNDRIVNMKSILGVLSLAIGYQKQFTVQTDGVDEAEAIAVISERLQEKGLASE
ncbi:MAG TPA: HPr family phosphocarrier protein [Sporosarcina sp.]|nr:HPr family phosphocarrier protein [Sporosarcina sp.]